MSVVEGQAPSGGLAPSGGWTPAHHQRPPPQRQRRSDGGRVRVCCGRVLVVTNVLLHGNAGGWRWAAHPSMAGPGSRRHAGPGWGREQAGRRRRRRPRGPTGSQRWPANTRSAPALSPRNRASRHAMQQTAKLPSPMSICHNERRTTMGLLPDERMGRGRGRGRTVGGIPPWPGWGRCLGGHRWPPGSPRRPLASARSVAGLVVPGSRRAVRVPHPTQRVRPAARSAPGRFRWRASSVPQSPQQATNSGAVQPTPCPTG